MSDVGSAVISFLAFHLQGMVSIFNLGDIPSKTCCIVHPNNKSHYNSHFVRQCAFSEDGSILLAVDDNASVVQYERI